MWFLLRLAAVVVFSALSAWLRPKPEGPKPATLDDFSVPRLEQGTEFYIVHGTRLVSPLVHAHGDFDSSEISKKVSKK